jgi:GTPase
VFWDTAEIKVKAGDGGDGRTSFLHEKFREKGGPDGGDGGRGGDVILEAKAGETTLSYFRTRRELKAEAGEDGKRRKQHGRSGEDLVVQVPSGTVVKDSSGEELADLTEPGSRFQAAKGGRGGFGNAHFISSTRQTPEVAEVGEPGEERALTLELKLIADVGLVGLPNAGKSTLLARITAAKPKIAPYPFTTIVPNLGVVEERGFHFIVSDIPGLIEGASEGRGLGHEFLRHVQRTKLLVHLIDGTTADPAGDYRTVRAELKKFDSRLSSKPELVVINKVDQPGAAEVKVGKQVDARISAATGEGVSELLGMIAERLQQISKEEKASEKVATTKIVRRHRAEDDPDLFLVQKESVGWRVTGGKVEEFARRMDLSLRPAQTRMRDIMTKLGVTRELARQGAKDGDPVHIGKQSLPLRAPTGRRPKS